MVLQRACNLLRIGMLVLVAGAAGCHAPAPAAHPEPRGLVWILPGIGGGAWSMGGAYRAFRDGGVDAEIRIQEWDRPILDALGHLQKLEQNRALAARVAQETAKFWDARSEPPIDLIGYSAGGGIALLVAEALPERVRLRHVILVQPGVSPTWNLSPALRRVDGRLVNFYCPSDWLILGWGTRTFGTVDRQKVESAGKVGFRFPAAAEDEQLRAKIVEYRWRPEMIATGHLGEHTGILLYAWNKKYVLPWLLGQVLQP